MRQYFVEKGVMLIILGGFTIFFLLVKLAIKKRLAKKKIQREFEERMFGAAIEGVFNFVIAALTFLVPLEKYSPINVYLQALIITLTAFCGLKGYKEYKKIEGEYKRVKEK